MRVFFGDGQKRKLALFFWDRGSVKYQTDKETTEANLFDGCSIFLEAQVIQLGKSIGSTFSDIYRWISSTLPQCHQNKRCNNMQTNPSHGTKCPCPHQRVWIPQVPLETINGQQCFIRAPNILSKEKCIRWTFKFNSLHLAYGILTTYNGNAFTPIGVLFNKRHILRRQSP